MNNIRVSPTKDFRIENLAYSRLIVESRVWGRRAKYILSQTFDSHNYVNTGKMCNGRLADTNGVNNVLCFD